MLTSCTTPPDTVMVTNGGCPRSVNRAGTGKDDAKSFQGSASLPCATASTNVSPQISCDDQPSPSLAAAMARSKACSIVSASTTTVLASYEAKLHCTVQSFIGVSSKQVQLVARVFIEQADVQRLLGFSWDQRRARLRRQTLAQGDGANAGNEHLLAAFAPFRLGSDARAHVHAASLASSCCAVATFRMKSAALDAMLAA